MPLQLPIPTNLSRLNLIDCNYYFHKYMSIRPDLLQPVIGLYKAFAAGVSGIPSHSGTENGMYDNSCRGKSGG